jgi:hypothetical protein
MTMNRTSIFRSALGLLTMRGIAMQIGLGLLVFVLSVAWLRVPDASALEVVGSGLLGLIVLALAGGGQAVLLLRMCDRPRTRTRIAIGGVAILFGIALWLAWNALLYHVAEHDTLWAGYLNSRFPHGLRNLFSYPHIIELFTLLGKGLKWVGDGIILAIVVSLVASAHPARAFGGSLRSFAYWIVLVVDLFVLENATAWLANWTPGHGIAVESASLVARMIVLVLLDGLLVSLLFAVAAASVRRYDTPVGTPEDNQPRTVANP